MNKFSSISLKMCFDLTSLRLIDTKFEWLNVTSSGDFSWLATSLSTTDPFGDDEVLVLALLLAEEVEALGETTALSLHY